MTRALLILAAAAAYWLAANGIAYALGWSLAEMALVVACYALAVAVLR